VSTIVQIVVVLALAPLAHGAMRSLRARLAGRPGPSPVQPYRDLAKLWTKEAVIPEGVSPLVFATPGLVLGIAVVFAAAIPVSGGAAAKAIDIIGLAMLLALGRFAIVLTALDSRSAFTGMAASREMSFSVLVEPALIIAVLGGMALGTSSLAGFGTGPFDLAKFLSAAGLFVVILAETARVPIDNQETHYELTMIHEGLVLEYAGWQLGMLNYAAQIRQACFLVLIALMMPGAGLPAVVGWVAFFAVAITLVETLFAKVRLFEIPQLVVAALIFAVAGILLRAGVTF
jgi:formate hydrogenlyase subunit 4